MPPTFSSREFARDAAAIKRATANGPVFVTDRGRPALAVLSIEDYYRLAGTPDETLLEAMQRIPGGDPAIELDLPVREAPVFEGRIPSLDAAPAAKPTR